MDLASVGESPKATTSVGETMGLARSSFAAMAVASLMQTLGVRDEEADEFVGLRLKDAHGSLRKAASSCVSLRRTVGGSRH